MVLFEPFLDDLELQREVLLWMDSYSEHQDRVFLSEIKFCGESEYREFKQ